MTTDSETVDRRHQVIAFRNMAMLLLILIPLAIGSIWVAQRGSHGYAVRCDFDRDGRIATFHFLGNPIHTPFGTGRPCRIRSFDLEHGEKVYLERFMGLMIGLTDSSAISVDGKGKYELYGWDTIPTGSDIPIVFEVPMEEGYKLNSIEPIDGMAICFMVGPTGSRLVLLDPITGKLLDTVELSLDRGSISVVWRTNCFSIEGITGNWTTKANVLARVKDGKIELLEEWGAEFVGAALDDFGEVIVGTLSADSKFVEIRNPKGKELKTSFELPPTQSGIVAQNQVLLWQSWVSVYDGVTIQNLDSVTGKLLPTPDKCRIVDRNRASKRLLVSSIATSQSNLIDEESGEIVSEVTTGTAIFGSKFVDDGKRLLIGNSFQQVIEIDALTGKTLRVFDKYWMIPYLEFLTAIFFVVWTCCWLRNSVNLHHYAWLDCAFITGLCVGYVLIRSRMTGFFDDVTRPIYQLSEGIFAAWMILSSLWLVLGRTRLSLRILPQIGIAGIICLIAMICVGFQNYRVGELVIAVCLLSGWLIVAFLPIRFLGHQFVQIHPKESIEQNDSLAKGAVSLRDLFLLTAVIACVMAVAKMAPSGMQVTILMLVNLFVLVCSLTLTGIAAARFGLSRRSWLVRSITLLVAVAIGMFLPLVWNAVNRGWKEIFSPDQSFVFWELRLHAATALATILCLYAYRLRGWRLKRTFQEATRLS